VVQASGQGGGGGKIGIQGKERFFPQEEGFSGTNVGCRANGTMIRWKEKKKEKEFFSLEGAYSVRGLLFDVKE